MYSLVHRVAVEAHPSFGQKELSVPY